MTRLVLGVLVLWASAVGAFAADRKTLVLATNFSDVALSCTVADVADKVFTNPTGYSVAELFRESSHGQVVLTGDVASVTIPATSQSACDYFGWASAALAAASNQGIDVASYQHRLYVMPLSTCEAAGFAFVGGPAPTDAWIFSCAIRGIYAHEFGHNLGMDHASTPTNELGDETDPMTFSDVWLRGVNAPHQHQLGWLGDTGLQTITQSGTYTIGPLATALDGRPKAVRLLKADTGDYYYFSYRTSVGFDRSIALAAIDRVSVHRYRGDGSGTRTFLLTALGDGESFTDPVNGIAVSVIAHDANGVIISVTLIPPPPPTDTTAPTAPSGLTAQYVSKTKTVSLTWQGSTDAVGVVAYDIQRNGLVIGVTSGLSWIDNTAQAGGWYLYAVVARDAAGNVSAQSNVASLTVPGKWK